jgi:hypothetical protein
MYLTIDYRPNCLIHTCAFFVICVAYLHVFNNALVFTKKCKSLKFSVIISNDSGRFCCLPDGVGIFKQKIPKFWRARDWKRFVCLLAIRNTYSTAIWYVVWHLGIYPPVLVYCVKKNLATLVADLVVAQSLIFSDTKMLSHD